MLSSQIAQDGRGNVTVNFRPSIATTIATGTTYLLGISLSGSSVNVTLNGTDTLSYSYFSLLNDGKVGLFGQSGSATFDNVKISGDDPAYLNQALP